MSGDRLDVGVIGVGSMGSHHARVYDELPDVDLVGVFDVDDQQAKETANEYDTDVFELDDLVDAVNAVSIVVPTQHHYEIARTCIESDVHVLVEKPFVEDPSHGEKLTDLAESPGVTIQVGHVERFNPAVMALDDIIGDLDIVAIDARRLGPSPERGILDTVVMDLMIHDIDVVTALKEQEPTSVQAVGTKAGSYASASFTFEDDSVATLTASRITQEKVRRLDITTEECLIKLDYLSQSVRIHRHSLPEYIQGHSGVRYRHESVIEQPAIDSEEPLKNELSAFIHTVRSGERPRVSGMDGLRALEFAREIDRRAFADEVTE